ncbi:enoyl-CoA hydratase/isomerase family protein [Williamsia soli]|uniref:enoyl-CoA hydratase/isomerase family protein n=1 Tax=Williamsia soli TaxID=364929 RepID=UPI001A9F18F7|nr:enoyl-CoA hydratase/isomerase family protein [Williamsia soli]
MAADEHGPALLAEHPAPGVLRLTLNRPQVHNAMSVALQRDLDDVLMASADDDDVRAVIITGAGADAFSAGYDLKELAEMSPAHTASVMLERDELLWRYLTLPKPTVAAITGAAFGAGTIIAACSDLRVGGPSTQLTVSGARYGGASLTWLLDDLIGAGRARDLLMTSRTVEGEEAYRIGLLSRYDSDIAAQALHTAIELAAQPAAGLRDLKALLLDRHGRDLRARFDRENTLARRALGTRSVAEMFAGFFSGGGT